MHWPPGLRPGGRALLAGALVTLACSLGLSQDVGRRNGRLVARPRPVLAAPGPGFSALAIGRERDGILYVPHATKNGPVPLVILLHGAGGDAQGLRRRLFGISDSIDFAMLIPDSRGPTWDAIRGDYGPDIAFIDSALKIVFSRIAVDSTRVTVGGFSDGASYALALGRINGDLFSRVLAFSPGFVPPGSPAGKPDIYITHGSADRILPFEATSRRIVPMLKQAGYEVTLKHFIGGHTVPADVAREAFRWAVAPRGARASR
jgi:phospholipase/carboxylesterase